MSNEDLLEVFTTSDKLAKEIWNLFKSGKEAKAIKYFDSGCDYFGKDKMIQAMYENS
ncbi:hypothetical protein [Solidesulfovibrio fructosivorans]|uniref:hypothetical protein n=1 Tax=Solidesulfovibrio fructosivorans TaxID=878 RepID=UPI00130530CC|nr:hypothetical protein [Solidesulfovibrio fructosivorans]